MAHLLRVAGGDARRALTALEAGAGAALATAGDDRPAVLDVQTLETAVDRAALRYDRDGDQHYDVISAFIKSVRGSDVDAALHYLARMIEAGEDPRFIARRLVILASEDIGLADPTALLAAVAAADAVALIGMPEARINLAQAVIHLTAGAEVQRGDRWRSTRRSPTSRPGWPARCRPRCGTRTTAAPARSGPASATSTRTTSPAGWPPQQYPPDAVLPRTYYRPTRLRRRGPAGRPLGEAARPRPRHLSATRPRQDPLDADAPRPAACLLRERPVRGVTSAARSRGSGPGSQVQRRAECAGLGASR